MTPGAGSVLTPGAFYEQTWYRSTRRCHIQNIKSLRLSVSEKKNFEDWLLCSYAPTCDPRGMTGFDPRGIKWTNLVKVQKEMIYTKYQSSRPSSFREEEFWSLPSLFLCSNLWHPPGRGQWPQGDHLTKLGRGSLGDATHQTSKLYVIYFQRRRFSKILHFFPFGCHGNQSYEWN